jgi:hypothetical protein
MSTARQSRNQKETPTTEARRKSKATVNSQQSPQYREHTELPKTRRAEEKRNTNIKQTNSSRDETDLIISNADRKKIGVGAFQLRASI